MSGSKGRDTRRNDGFRIADARQVRIEALERSVKVLRLERDTARNDVERAQREVRALCAANDGLGRQRDSAQNVAIGEMGAADLVRQERDALRREVAQLRTAAASHSLTWWDRLFGAKA